MSASKFRYLAWALSMALATPSIRAVGGGGDEGIARLSHVTRSLEHPAEVVMATQATGTDESGSGFLHRFGFGIDARHPVSALLAELTVYYGPELAWSSGNSRRCRRGVGWVAASGGRAALDEGRAIARSRSRCPATGAFLPATTRRWKMAVAR